MWFVSLEECWKSQHNGFVQILPSLIHSRTQMFISLELRSFFSLLVSMSTVYISSTKSKLLQCSSRCQYNSAANCLVKQYAWHLVATHGNIQSLFHRVTLVLVATLDILWMRAYCSSRIVFFSFSFYLCNWRDTVDPTTFLKCVNIVQFPFKKK